MLNTLFGQSLAVSIPASGVMINSSNVTTADIQSDNGVVHVIDAVLNSSPNTVKEIDANTFKIYPNPATDIIKIESQVRNAFENVSIYDINGRNVLQTIVSNDNFIDVSELERGSYILELTSKNKIEVLKLQIL